MSYDMCVDAAVLEELSVNLNSIQNNLKITVDEMRSSIDNSRSLLEGRQFDRAVEITDSCIQATARTNTNIIKAIKYLNDLSELIREYNTCKYTGGK